MVLVTENPEVMAAGLAAMDGVAPLLAAATGANWEAMAKLATEYKAPLVARADSIEALAELTEKLTGAGVEDLVLDPAAGDFGSNLTMLTQLRRMALKNVSRSAIPSSLSPIRAPMTRNSRPCWPRNRSPNMPVWSC